VSATSALLSKILPGQGRTLVVGSRVYGECPDRRLLYPDAVGLDMLAGDGVDIVHDLEQPLPAHFGMFDHIDCCSVLEHVAHPWLLAKNIEDAMVEGGTLLVIAPFIWRQHGYPNDFWRYTPESLYVLFPHIRWLENRLYCNGEFVKKAPAFNDDDGTRWMARTEVAAMGVKCSSTS
jgi:hypothetical protein